MNDQRLMDYFGFNQADLAANRAGRFTEEQRARLIQEDKGHRRGSLGGAIFYGLLALLGLGIAASGLAQSRGHGANLELTLGFGVFWPLFFGYMCFSAVRSALSQHDLTLAKVQGEANIVRKETAATSDRVSHVYYELHIGGKAFEVESDLADVLAQGKRYILYYLSGSSEILSAEQVGAAP